MTFSDYLDEVQRYAGLAPRPLICGWKPSVAQSVENAVGAAIQASTYIGWSMPNFSGSNQSLGNQAAKAFISKIKGSFSTGFKIETAPQAGYPDTIITIHGEKHFLEFKATSDWKEKDGNRRVLTSSPIKMRTLIADGLVDDPPAHAMATVHYLKGGSRVTGFRLDFLEPNSAVNVRLEASTSHKLLHDGHQRTWTAP